MAGSGGDRPAPGDAAVHLYRTYLVRHGIFVWHGNFYALNLSEALGLEPRAGDPILITGHEVPRGTELVATATEHGNAAIMGGSQGWSSAGLFHEARVQLHRFFAASGGKHRVRVSLDMSRLTSLSVYPRLRRQS